MGIPELQQIAAPAGGYVGALAVLEEAERLPGSTCTKHAWPRAGIERRQERAESVLRRAIAMDPSISEAHYRLVCCSAPQVAR